MAERIDLGKVSLIPRGQHFPDVEYKRLHWVTDAGNSYVYINPAPSTGALLTSTEHWMLFAQRGAKIISGTFVNDVFTFVLDDGSTFDVEYAGVTAATQAAVDAAALANEKADLANQKALLADEKATLANQAAVDVTQAIQSTETATLSALEAQDANADWTKDGRNPAEYFPAPSAPLYYKIEGSFTQAGSGDPSPENIRPITPFMANGAQIKLANSGKNLLDVPGYFSKSAPITLSGNIITITNPPGPVSILWKPDGLKAGKTYTLSFDMASTISVYADLQPDHVEHPNWLAVQGKNTIAFMTTSNYVGGGIRFFVLGAATGTATITNIQLELGVATAYEPYVGSTATLTAPEEIAAGWINNRGEGQATWEKYVFTGNENFTVSVSNWQSEGRFSAEASIILGGKKTVYSSLANSMCTHAKRGEWYWSAESAESLHAADDTRVFLRFANTLLGIIEGDTEGGKITKLKNYLLAQSNAGTPVTVFYRLKDPVSLAPVSAPINSIPALDLAAERLNVFISSLSGVLTYPKNKVRQDRILNNSQLWRKITSGNPVSVYPAPESLLYPKVSGTFTQAGTGNPSPENIRPITPWLANGAQVKVKRTGKNLLAFPFVNPNFAINYAPGNVTTVSGVTFTVNANGSITLSGTASAYISYNINKTNIGTGVYLSTNVTPSSGGYTISCTNGRLAYTGGNQMTFIQVASGEVTNYTVYPQIELGSVATPYEPYSGQEITLTAPQEIPAGWMDNEGNGQVTWVKKVFDGTETLSSVTDLGNVLRASSIYLTYKPITDAAVSACTHLVHAASYSADTPHHYVGTNAPNNGLIWLFVPKSLLSSNDADGVKAYLAAQYAAGTPVTVVYQVANPVPLTLAIAPLTATPQLDRVTPRQNVVTTSAGVLEVAYAEYPEHSEFDFGHVLDTAKSEKMMQYEHISQMRFYGSMNGMTKEVPKVLSFEYRGAKNYINGGERESGVVHTGYAEVKWQGTSSIAFPKKNFTVKLFEDAALTTKKEVALRATWGEQNKYCMKANFIDSTQCRNVVAAKVWGDMVRSRNTSSESYIRMHDLPNAGAVDGYPILVFLNDQYIGLYTMNIPKDEWTFGMKDGEGTNVVLCGESWVYSTEFWAPAVIDGSDWDYEVEPADKSWVVNSFNGIYNALALPHGTEQEKTAKRSALEAVVDIFSVIDYQIFLEALCVTDNTGKNQLLVTYDGTKWIMSAYDLDTAFAMHWSGARYARNDTAVNTNNLTNTVKTLYPTEYNARKIALKTGALNPKGILQAILNFAIDIPQEAYRAEAELWPDQCGANTNAMQQIISFVMTRPELNS